MQQRRILRLKSKKKSTKLLGLEQSLSRCVYLLICVVARFGYYLFFGCLQFNLIWSTVSKWRTIWRKGKCKSCRGAWSYCSSKRGSRTRKSNLTAINWCVVYCHGINRSISYGYDRVSALWTVALTVVLLTNCTFVSCRSPEGIGMMTTRFTVSI